MAHCGQSLEGRLIPAGMHDPEVLPLAHDGLTAKEAQDLLPLAVGPHHALSLRDRPVPKEPGVLVLPLPGQGVEIVVAKHHRGRPAVDQVGHPPHDPGAVGPTVDQVADEDQSPALGVGAGLGVPQALKEGAEGFQLAVEVSDQVQGSIRELALGAPAATRAGGFLGLLVGKTVMGVVGGRHGELLHPQYSSIFS